MGTVMSLGTCLNRSQAFFLCLSPSHFQKALLQLDRAQLLSLAVIIPFLRPLPGLLSFKVNAFSFLTFIWGKCKDLQY
jgi:hypothetical protein